MIVTLFLEIANLLNKMAGYFESVTIKKAKAACNADGFTLFLN